MYPNFQFGPRCDRAVSPQGNGGNGTDGTFPGSLVFLKNGEISTRNHTMTRRYLRPPESLSSPRPPNRERRIYCNHLFFNHLFTLSLLHFLLSKFADYYPGQAHNSPMIANQKSTAGPESLPFYSLLAIPSSLSSSSLGPGAYPERTRRISISRFSLSGIRPVHDSRPTAHDLRLTIHGPRKTAPRFTSSLLHFSLLHSFIDSLAPSLPCSLVPCLSGP